MLILRRFYIMTKSILISVRPEHAVDILNGKKTLETARKYGIEILEYEEVSTDDYATREVKEYIKRENEKENKK